MHSIYKPLGARSTEFGSQVAVDTPPATLERCSQLQVAFTELKADMMEELNDIEKKLVIPAKIARSSLGPMKKAIKKREDKKASRRLSNGPSTGMLTSSLGRLRTLQEPHRSAE